MLRLAFTAILYAPLAASCATPPPPAEQVCALGLVRASDADSAHTITAIATEATARVCRMLDIDPQPFAIHVYPDDTKQAANLRVWRDRSGAVIERVIELHAGERTALRFLVAHELAHWNVSGTAWDRLPHAVEEGLCDFVAVQVVPERRGERMLDLRGRAVRGLDAPLDAVLALTTRSWEFADESAKSSSYAVGYFLVERIGLDRLRRLCESTAALGASDVTVEQILEAAGLDRTSLMRELREWGAETDREPFELRQRLVP